VDGILCDPWGAGSGGGAANPEFVERLAGKDRTDLSPLSPRQVLLAHYVKPPHVPEHLDIFVESMLSTRTGEWWYPGDSRPVDAWPGFAPGDRGVLNTMAPTHFRIADLSGVAPKPPVLWVRGADDVIVSDTSLYDLAYLGSLGAIPGWPGEQTWPPQPMVAQTRAVLNGYAVAGGRYREAVIEDAGHGPHLDQPEQFLAELTEHLVGALLPPSRLPPSRLPPSRLPPPPRRGPESEEIRPARRLTPGAARFRHAEQDGRAPHEDQHSGDEDRPAGQHVPGHREQHPGQQEREPRAGAHDAGEPDQADDGNQRARSDPPAHPPARSPHRDARPAGGPDRRAPHHQVLPLPPWSHRYLVRLAATPRVPIVRFCARQNRAAGRANARPARPRHLVAASSRRIVSAASRPWPDPETGDPRGGTVTYPTRQARAAGAGAREGIRHECAGHR
jgi:hypothetical protein